jgi:hypothetical protein
MMKKKNLLKRLSVGFRCPMVWEEMDGEGAERFCVKCRKSVTDLTQLTEEEVRVFVRRAGSGGGACVRLQRRADGTLVTRGCPISGRGKVARGLVAGVATGVALSSCGSGPAGEGAIPPAKWNDGGVEDREERFEGPILLGVMICSEDDDEAP